MIYGYIRVSSDKQNCREPALRGNAPSRHDSIVTLKIVAIAIEANRQQ